ncbi:uncharacterized protein GVI51_D01441 [Nakaseomyces glabratus]|uniref:Uncharacterized protein n=2 Tax=Candida glabrata TaxID=5478 RepID=Q6FWB2_CANGA|nr:uncharacterized protein CAGL0D01540g [Nakaseomyces glabratus]KAH7589749.1 hypothetical protein J7298_00736 [Nakaseomyces glabratus]KAH7590830.1 hypothetical protein J7297_00739 [Nakaseomyces glabratus]KAH7596566.1 hypothetical protein J7296_00736 [Nakaseomyces glabratus]KAH7606422.1 hypothetical protein J7295_00739 [Nakaseomyces glabratus]KAH7608215.1 hypothetical protein J7293_00731 [Nakaseomyces glabratus]|eukprot:XP_445482.1 uncharacterized protein CAGL0D01540g [[Candida] glabrata]
MALNNVRRQDLCVQYKKSEPPRGIYSESQSLSGIVNQTMPMAAIFLKNKFIAWFSLIQSVHSYLNTDEETLEKNKSKTGNSALDQPPLVKVAMSLVGILVCYMNLVFPTPDAPPPSSEKKILDEEKK